MRSEARAANKAVSGAPSPCGDPGPAPLSRGAPGPGLGAGHAATRAHAGAPGLRGRPSLGSSRASQAKPAARPEGAKYSWAGSQAAPCRQSQKSETEEATPCRCRPSGNTVTPGRAGATALPAALEGRSGLPSGRKRATNFAATPAWKRRAPAEEAAGGDCCKQLFLIHISLHNQIMRPTTFSIIHR